MKRLYNFIKLNPLSIYLRNALNIRPIIANDINKKKNFSISDAFIWRTDNNFVTKFRFMDILNFFYGINASNIEINFFNSDFNKIKVIHIEKPELHNEVIIDEKLLNYKGYGIFNIFHQTKEKINSTIRNSCYVGYRKSASDIFSFVHGNTATYSKKFTEAKFFSNIIGSSFFCTNKYLIQKKFDDGNKSEIFIINPTSRSIKVKINNTKFTLDKNKIKMIDVTDFGKVEIVSNCYFLRPIIFIHENDNLDVFHG